MSDRQRALDHVETWFRNRGETPFPFQRRAWRSFLRGNHGLVHSATGSGKTLAAFLGVVMDHLSHDSELARKSTTTDVGDAVSQDGFKSAAALRKRRNASQIRVLWLTPLRSLASDIEENLRIVCNELGLGWHVETRTGDTPSSIRQRQSKAYPEVLITTPESCSLMLSYADTQTRFSELKLIVVDEWHELLGSKRGVQVELALARIRSLCPNVRIWGLSATLGNTTEALETLLGSDGLLSFELIEGASKKKLKIEAMLPDKAERFPWSGHIGTQLASRVAEIVLASKSCLVFTNTRAQTEIWYRSLLAVAPELVGQMAAHHGSLDQKLRWWIEDNLRSGKLRCCVCTSSLDLGVDFSHVDQVIQIGSPKGAARLLQRAGRSGHAPGKTSKLTFVPTNSMEIIEYVGLTDGIVSKTLECRPPLKQPIDVLTQHCVTIALGGGFVADELLQEVRRTAAYRNLSDEQWQWTLDFIQRGGDSLVAYPDFKRVQMVDGRYTLVDRRLAARHRMSIGTIVSDASIHVQYLNGARLGTVEESFLAKIKVGDKFMLGGKTITLVKLYDNTAYVKRATGSVTAIPRWMGGRMPLSNELSQAIRSRLDQASHGQLQGKEMRWLKPLLRAQEQSSAIPAWNELLVERLKNRDGHYLFFYPFDGRLVHEGLAAIIAHRLSNIEPMTFSLTMNDYGFALVSSKEVPVAWMNHHTLFSDKNLEADILGSLNATEMGKRQFKEIARVSNLVFQGYPGQKKLSRHLQASSNLFYDVFQNYDPGNLLLRQAETEVLDQQLQLERIRNSLARIQTSKLVVQSLAKPSPFSFGLIVDRMRERVSSESLGDRVRQMQERLEKDTVWTH